MGLSFAEFTAPQRLAHVNLGREESVHVRDALLRGTCLLAGPRPVSREAGSSLQAGASASWQPPRLLYHCFALSERERAQEESGGPR